MKIMRNFKCISGHVTEKRVPNNQNFVECKCGRVAFKMLSAPRCFGNTTGASPSTRY